MKKRILGLFLAFCTVFCFIPYTAMASDSFTVTVSAGTGGRVSADGNTWSDRVTVTVPAGEKIGDKVTYRADEGYELDSITSLNYITTVAAGQHFTVIIDDKGQVYTSGDSGNGKRAIGDPLTLASSSYSAWFFSKPTNGIDGSDIRAVAVGQNHTVILDGNGDVYTAGLNVKGQLGRDISDALKAKYPTLTSIPSENSFVKVNVGDGSVKIKAIAASAEHTVLVDENGKVWTAGYNYLKLLGRALSGRAEYEAAFGQAEGDINNASIVAVASGADQTVALDDNGKVWTVGQSFYGANGQGKRLTKFAECAVEGDPKIIAIAAGEKHTVLLDENGNVYTTGYNSTGQLGLGNNKTQTKFTKVSVDSGGAKIVSIAAGKDYTLLVDENGKVYAAGNNNCGQLGLPLETAKTNTFTPVTINGLGEQKIVSAAAGEDHTVLLDDAGRIWTAGSNKSFPLGRLVKPYKEKNPDFELAMSSTILSESVADLSDFAVNGNNTLTVNFKEREKVSVTYKLNSGNWVSGFTAPSFYYKGDSFTPPALTNLKKEGYTAKEWKIASQTESTVAYSVSWEEKSGYTVKYNTDGGKPIPDKTDVKWNDEVLEGIADPTKDGWSFTGWTFRGNEVYNDEYGSPCYSELADSDSILSITLDANWKDITAPVIKGLTDKKAYCSAVEFTATDNDGIASVTVNGTEIQAENGKYTLNPAQGGQRVIAKDNSGNTVEFNVTVNNGHTYEWQSENGEYWKKCSICNHETDKKDIPTVSIDISERVCRTQDCKFSFTLPEGVSSPTYGYRFIGAGDEHIAPTCENGVFYGIIKASEYIAEENSFKLTVTAETDDGFTFTEEKAIAVQDKHSGGKATCTEKAVCKICGESYGETNPQNHSGLKHFESKAATESSEGNIEYWYCEDCGKYYKDSAAGEEIERQATVTPKLESEKKSPKTGDTAGIPLIALLLICGGAVGSAVITGGKKKSLKAK